MGFEALTTRKVVGALADRETRERRVIAGPLRVLRINPGTGESAGVKPLSRDGLHNVHIMEPHPLAQEWRTTAKAIRRYSPDLARFLEAVAEDLDLYEKEYRLEALTLVQAAEESGYHPDHIGRLIAEGRIENVGMKGAPRTRRGDLPRKPKPVERTPRLENGDPDLAGEVLQRRGLMEL